MSAPPAVTLSPAVSDEEPELDAASTRKQIEEDLAYLASFMGRGLIQEQDYVDAVRNSLGLPLCHFPKEGSDGPYAGSTIILSRNVAGDIEGAPVTPVSEPSGIHDQLAEATVKAEKLALEKNPLNVDVMEMQGELLWLTDLQKRGLIAEREHTDAARALVGLPLSQTHPPMGYKSIYAGATLLVMTPLEAAQYVTLKEGGEPLQVEEEPAHTEPAMNLNLRSANAIAALAALTEAVDDDVEEESESESELDDDTESSDDDDEEEEGGARNRWGKALLGVRAQGGAANKWTFTLQAAKQQAELEHKVELCERIPLLRALPQSERVGLAPMMHVVSFAAGEEVISKGSEGGDMYIMTSGRAVVEINGDVVHSYSKCGDFFGELVMLNPARTRAATIKATTELHCLRLGRACFHLLTQVDACQHALCNAQSRYLDDEDSDVDSDDVDSDESSDDEDQSASLAAMREMRETRERGEYLRGVPLLEPLSAGELDKIAATLTQAQFFDGQRIVTEGEIGDTMFFVRSGTCVAVDGASKAEVKNYEATDFFGELSLLATGQKHTSSVVAKGPCTCLQLPRSQFRRSGIAAGPLGKIVLTLAGYSDDSCEEDSSSEEEGTGAYTPQVYFGSAPGKSWAGAFGAVKLQNFLKGIPAFAKLAAADVNALSTAMQKRSYNNGATVVCSGSEEPTMYVVMEGSVVIDEDVLSVGKTFGVDTLLGDGSQEGDIVAQGAVTCLTLSQHAFKYVLTSSGQQTILGLAGYTTDSDMGEDTSDEEENDEVEAPAMWGNLMKMVVTTNKTESFIETVPLFQGLPVADRAALSKMLSSVDFIGGQAIVNAGDRADAMYIVVSGGALAQKDDGFVLKEYDATDFFGELSLLQGGTRACSVVARGKTSCLRLSAECFKLLMANGACGDMIRSVTADMRTKKKSRFPRMRRSKSGAEAAAVDADGKLRLDESTPQRSAVTAGADTARAVTSAVTSRVSNVSNVAAGKVAAVVSTEHLDDKDVRKVAMQQAKKLGSHMPMKLVGDGADSAKKAAAGVAGAGKDIASALSPRNAMTAMKAENIEKMDDRDVRKVAAQKLGSLGSKMTGKFGRGEKKPKSEKKPKKSKKDKKDKSQ